MNKFVRSLLNIGLSALELSDRTATDVRSRVRDRMEDLTDRVEDLTDHTRNLMGMKENRVLRYGLSFAAGVGVGVGVGLLLAPATGEETRSTIAGKVQEAGTRVRDRFSPAMGATGTETR